MSSGKSRQTILPGADVKPAETRTVNWVEYITDTLRQHEQIEQRVIIQLQEYDGAQQVRVIKEYLHKRELFKDALLQLAERADKSVIKEK